MALDCAYWPGYPGQSRAPCAYAIIMRLNHEWRSSWRNRYVKRCLHKWIVIAVAIEAAMLEDSMTSREITLLWCIMVRDIPDVIQRAWHCHRSAWHSLGQWGWRAAIHCPAETGQTPWASEACLEHGMYLSIYQELKRAKFINLHHRTPFPS